MKLTGTFEVFETSEVANHHYFDVCVYLMFSIICSCYMEVNFTIIWWRMEIDITKTIIDI